MRSRGRKSPLKSDESQVASLFKGWVSRHTKDQLQRSQSYLNHLGMDHAFHRVAKQYLSESDLWSLALSDDLTGLLNRRGFLFLASQQLKLASRNGRDCVVFLCDVDGLKQINDRFGHAVGDEALVRTGRVLEDTFRDSDVLARVGGDEFAMLALETADEGLTTIYRRMREKLARANATESRYHLSLSLGAARATPAGAQVLDDLLLHADEDLYQAKFRRAETMPRSEATRYPVHHGPAEKICKVG
jgi:diguanylate cyclase (GGDEF)-like protein